MNHSVRQIETSQEQTPPQPPLDTTPLIPRRLTVIDLSLLAFFAIVLRLPSFFSSAPIGFDDGVYGISANSMRAGYAPYRSVFSSQGPLFLPIIYLADLLGLQRMNSARLAPLAAGVAVTIAVYFCATRLTTRRAAILAGALCASSGVVLWTTGPITSDGVSGAFAVCAVAAALSFRSKPSTRLAIVIALLVGAAVSTKSLLVIPAIGVAWLLVASTQRRIITALIPAGAFCVLLATSLPWGLTRVYEQSIGYHTSQPGSIDVLANLDKITGTILDRDPPLLLLSILCILFAIFAAFRRDKKDAPSRQETSKAPLINRLTTGNRFLWIWLAASIALLLAEQKLWNNHIAIMAPPVALLISCHLPPWRAVAIVLVISIPLQISGMTQIYRPTPLTGDSALAQRAISRVGDSWALSDTPGLIWRAGASTDPWFVDGSQLRIATSKAESQITSKSLAGAAAQARVCMVVITSEKRWGSFPDLPQRLKAIGYEKTESFKTGTLGIYERPCN